MTTSYQLVSALRMINQKVRYAVIAPFIKTRCLRGSIPILKIMVPTNLRTPMGVKAAAGVTGMLVGPPKALKGTSR